MAPQEAKQHMPFTREYWEEQELSALAPYALKSRYAKREHEEPRKLRFRTHFQRDWHRILHSFYFRKLEYKTQVFPFGEGLDITRNRLTHTLEVFQIAASLACGLGANVDAVKAIALAHDLGHPPFGHTGERALKRLARRFNHNRHGLRIVRELEVRYPAYKGLNLTLDVLEGIAKHKSDYDVPVADAKIQPGPFPSLEGQIVDYGDTVAYRCHDLEDALRSHILDFDTVLREPPEIMAEVARNTQVKDTDILLSTIIRNLIGRYVDDIIETSLRTISTRNIHSPDHVRHASAGTIAMSAHMQALDQELGAYLMDNFYCDFRIKRMMKKGEQVIERLFSLFSQDSQLLPPAVRQEIADMPAEKTRIVADYIASLSDREAMQEYHAILP